MKPINKIVNIMEQKKLKYSDLADYLGVNKSLVSAWKQRNTNPPLEYVVQICEFLDITIYELLNIEYEQSELEKLYSKASDKDKSYIDFILSQYKDNQEQKSLDSKIG